LGFLKILRNFGTLFLAKQTNEINLWSVRWTKTDYKLGSTS
jgi:hypothetical protein